MHPRFWMPLVFAAALRPSRPHLAERPGVVELSLSRGDRPARRRNAYQNEMVRG